MDISFDFNAVCNEFQTMTSLNTSLTFILKYVTFQ